MFKHPKHNWKQSIDGDEQWIPNGLELIEDIIRFRFPGPHYFVEEEQVQPCGQSSSSSSLQPADDATSTLLSNQYVNAGHAFDWSQNL